MSFTPMTNTLHPGSSVTTGGKVSLTSNLSIALGKDWLELGLTGLMPPPKDCKGFCKNLKLIAMAVTALMDKNSKA